MTWDGACIRTAEDADHGPTELQKKVKEGARRQHDSELMKQVDRARESIAQAAEAAGTKVEGEKNWITLIQNVSKDNREYY